MQPIELNRHGRIVFPCNFFPDLDFSTLRGIEQFEAVIRRDFDAKAPTGSDILARIQRGGYRDKFELMRDMALNLFWVNRYMITMFNKRPTRWADVPRGRDDIYVPILTPWVDGETKVAAVANVFPTLPARWDEAVEQRIFGELFGIFGTRRSHATAPPRITAAVRPTVARLMSDPRNLTLRLGDYDPDFPRFSYAEIIDCHEQVAELEALRRWVMVLHNQYPWDRAKAELVEVAQLRDDDYVVVFEPRDRQVERFIDRVTKGTRIPERLSPNFVAPVAPARPYSAIEVRADFAVWPKIKALAVAEGDLVCTNEDLIRNAAYNWSPMTAADIQAKTGIEQRRYTSGTLEDLALHAAKAAVLHAQIGPEEIGAVLVCSCTSSRLIPSLACWISGELGIFQTQGSFDLIAACAGLPYGLAEATRTLQQTRRPVLLVCVEKFSDKIGSVRPSRMIFGDGAAAVLLGVAEAGEPPDIEFLQIYASGPSSQVNSIIWPNPDFDNSITVYGPEVKALAGRYLEQMLGEIAALPNPDGAGGSLLDSIELVVPHQANKTMVIELAEKAGLSAEHLYFNIERVGNSSSASIPIAIHDAVREGVITRPIRIFAPGFGAGAVAGYAVLRIDPAILPPIELAGEPAHVPFPAPSSRDVELAFG
ncbi:3-oxoacyl-ACP synthase III family protein [Mycolicibacterium tusciae]|uniref:3-oxoacyl-ACP synthase III family protein n=1 Tax=Mycolicibacterium tusciae TaxID=75922 RepID=UPI00024A2F02|nr:3-oxoacyl-[acyl-carrier-protein] synthase III C-terminal domain-containing protein [Mycolicibacterium tusciae]